MTPKTIDQICQECLLATRSVFPTKVPGGKLYKWKGYVTSFILGELKFSAIPHYGLTICDNSSSISCLLVDPVKNVDKLLNLCNHTILFKDPEFIVEILVTDTTEYNLVSVFIYAEKLHIVEKNLKITLFQKKSVNLISSNCSNSNSFQQFVPLKISSAILTLKSEIFCFVLVIYKNIEQSDDDTYTWLILKNSQAVWKDLLLPNRVYTIENSSKIPLDYFKSTQYYKSLIPIVEENLDLLFRQMLHHKELIKTNKCIFLPQDSKIFIDNQNLVSTLHEEKWFSINDKNLNCLKFASVFGIIEDINFTESWKSLSCSWCNNDYVLEQTVIADTKNSEEKFNQNNSNFQFSWLDPVSETQEEIKLERKWFPSVCIDDSLLKMGKKEGFGIKRGKINVQITLRAVNSDEKSHVFLKRWQLQQYPVGLIKGITVCFTDVNIKCSKKKNKYFISTPLTRVIHLDTMVDRISNSSALWGHFGFPNIRIPNKKIWGMLDLDLLAKVSITAKCKLCCEPFSRFSCSNVFCLNNNKKGESLYEVNSVARLFSRGFVGYETAIVFLKNDHVKMYLDIPDNIWNKLCKLSAKAELQYLHDKDSVEIHSYDSGNIFFHIYCKYFRSKKRFHIACKLFEGSENRFFCVNLEEVNAYRLSVTHLEVNDRINKKKMELIT